MTLNTIIVEDEPLSRIFLNNLLKEFCPEIEVLAMVSSNAAAEEAIDTLHPDLVFLDIELQDGTGFDLLRKKLPGTFQVIFTTALDHYAINAIKMSGVDFLQKPIDINELRDAIHLVGRKRNTPRAHTPLHYLLETINNNNRPLHISVPLTEGETYLLLQDVVRVEGRVDGSCFVLKNDRKIYSHKNLKEYESLLTDQAFFRPHQDHLINENEIQAILEGTVPYILMQDGSKVPLSPKKKAALTLILDVDKSL